MDSKKLKDDQQRLADWRQERIALNECLQRMTTRCEEAEQQLENAQAHMKQRAESWSSERAKMHTQLQRKIFENRQANAKLAQTQQALEQFVEQKLARHHNSDDDATLAHTTQENIKAALQRLHQAQKKHEALWQQKVAKLQTELTQSHAETRKLKATLDDAYLSFEQRSQDWLEKQQHLTREHEQIKTQLEQAYRQSQKHGKATVSFDPMIFHLDDLLSPGKSGD